MFDTNSAFFPLTQGPLANHVREDAGPLESLEQAVNQALGKMKNPELAFALFINVMVNEIHLSNVAAGWWTNIETGEPLQRNVPEMLALAHSELSEALEGFRKGLPDDKLPHRSMYEVEIADVLIRLFDQSGGNTTMGKYATSALVPGGVELDVGTALVEKIFHNKVREDHKIENRKGVHGKKI